MQDLPYSSMEGLLRFLPEAQLVIVERLRELCLECLPEAEERLTFYVPFYKRYTNICYIWPGAVPWGTKTREGVEFAFVQGHLLADEMQYLEQGNRKQVFSKRFFNPSEIKEDLLRAYLYEALEIDEMLHLDTLKRRKGR